MKRVQQNLFRLMDVYPEHKQYWIKKYGSMAKSGELFAEIIRKKPEGKYFYYYAMILAKLGDRVNALSNMQIALSRYSGDLTEDQIATARRTIEAWK